MVRLRRDVQNIFPFFPMWQVLDIPKVKQVETKVFDGAMAIWSEFYGKPRLSGSLRIKRRDVGCPRKVEGKGKPSIAGWMKDRGIKISRLVAHRAKQVGGPASSDDIRHAELWTDGHDKEMRFVKDMVG